jgi:ribose 5-phosphate isomerase B
VALDAIPSRVAGTVGQLRYGRTRGVLTGLRIALASDHAGFRHKIVLADWMASQGFQVVDFGTDSEDPVDYPDFIRPAAEAVMSGKCDVGVVLGGSGNGEAMAANRMKGIRCAVCWSEETARLAKVHNDANMISIGQRMVTEQEAVAIVSAWLGAQFEGGRHIPRIRKLDA